MSSSAHAFFDRSGPHDFMAPMGVDYNRLLVYNEIKKGWLPIDCGSWSLNCKRCVMSCQLRHKASKTSVLSWAGSRNENRNSCLASQKMRGHTEHEVADSPMVTCGRQLIRQATEAPMRQWISWTTLMSSQPDRRPGQPDRRIVCLTGAQATQRATNCAGPGENLSMGPRDFSHTQLSMTCCTCSGVFGV